MKNFFAAILLGIALASCTPYPVKAPVIQDGYRIETYDSEGTLERIDVIDTYKQDPAIPEIKFKGDDGKTIKSNDYLIQSLYTI